MNRSLRRVFVACIAALLPFACSSSAAELSDNDIRDLLIKASIAIYDGACPCPFTVKSNGQECGRGSGRSSGGGQKVLCYRSDVTQRMIDAYRNR